jgi:hypothetical protein
VIAVEAEWAICDDKGLLIILDGGTILPDHDTIAEGRECT